jgi:hypothetical protein
MLGVAIVVSTVVHVMCLSFFYISLTMQAVWTKEITTLPSIGATRLRLASTGLGHIKLTEFVVLRISR